MGKVNDVTRPSSIPRKAPLTSECSATNNRQVPDPGHSTGESERKAVRHHASTLAPPPLRPPLTCAPVKQLLFLRSTASHAVYANESMGQTVRADLTGHRRRACFDPRHAPPRPST